MKKIIIIDGGPRRNMNTAQMLQRLADGAKSVDTDVVVKTVRLYDFEYMGCMSCMACKIKGNASNVCRYKDALTPLLEDIADAEMPHMGLTTWKNAPDGRVQKSDTIIAKNYLSDKEVTALDRLSTSFLDLAESLASQQILFTMAD